MMWDLVIVGGGPAGSTAARRARSHGLSVCVIDKRRFPRHKLCGGGMTGRARTFFNAVFGLENWPTDLILESDQVALQMGAERKATYTAPLPIALIHRHEFDARLLSLAEAAGAVTMLGDGVTGVEAGAVTLSSGARVEGRIIIGADGASSVVSRYILGRRAEGDEMNIALEAEIPRAQMPGQDDAVEIDLTAADYGYGWVFPKKDTFTVGVCGFASKNKEMKDCMQAYLDVKGVPAESVKVKGHHIRLMPPRFFGRYAREFKSYIGKGAVIAIGDASGATDPFTGEGIANAMLTGTMAADSAAEALAANNPEGVHALYAKRYAPLARDLRHSAMVCSIAHYGPLKRRFVGSISNSPRSQRVARGVFLIMDGLRSYSDALRRIPSHTLRLLLGRV